MPEKRLTKVDIIKKVISLNTKLAALAKKAEPIKEERDNLLEDLRSRCKHQDLIEYSAGFGDYDNDHYKSYRKCINCGVEESGKRNTAPYSNGDYNVFENFIGEHTHVSRDEYYKAQVKIDTLVDKVHKNAVEV